MPIEPDDELDALLGALGSPAGAEPETPADRILAMAAPPVVVVRPAVSRWMLGGALAAATVFGFVGGAAAMYLVGTGFRDAPAQDRAEQALVRAPAEDRVAEAPAEIPQPTGGSLPDTTASRPDAFAPTAPADVSTGVATAAPARIERAPAAGAPAVASPATSTTDQADAPVDTYVASRPSHGRLVGQAVGFGNRPSGEDPFASIPFTDEAVDAPEVTESLAENDVDLHTPDPKDPVDRTSSAPTSPGRDAARSRRHGAVDRTATRTEAVRPTRSPFSVAFDLGGRQFSARDARDALGVTTGASVRLDLAQGSVRPTLELGMDAGAGMIPGVGPLAVTPRLGAEIEALFGRVAPSLGWSVSMPLLPGHGDALALMTGPSLGVDIGRQDRPHFRARVDIETPVDRLAEGVVDANLAVSGGVEIPLGTW